MGFLAILAIVATLVTPGAVAPFDVVKELTLEFRSYLFTVDDGFQVGSLESFGEFGGLFVFGSAGEMRFIRVAWRREPASFSSFGLISFFLNLIFFRSFDFEKVEEIRDRRLDASEVRWVRACVDCPFCSTVGKRDKEVE